MFLSPINKQYRIITWIKSGLFWRTFFLLLCLVTISLIIWILFDLAEHPTHPNIFKTSTYWQPLVITILALSLGWAAIIATFIHLPLSRLTAAAHMIAKGTFPPLLPETGPREIQETNRSFNHMVIDLQRIELDRALILAGISHDLRTPMTRIALEIEMLNLPHDIRTEIENDLQQMNAVVQQFLDYAHPVETVHFKHINLSTLLKDIINTAAHLPKVQINATIHDHLYVIGGQVELSRIFHNLIENARQYGQIPGHQDVKIDVFATRTEQHVLIQLRDHGVGISPDKHYDLLRPFVRGNQARTGATGIGLGLSIVHRIVLSHHGTLTLSNHALGGLQIEIRLPYNTATRYLSLLEKVKSIISSQASDVSNQT